MQKDFRVSRSMVRYDWGVIGDGDRHCLFTHFVDKVTPLLPLFPSLSSLSLPPSSPSLLAFISSSLILWIGEGKGIDRRPQYAWTMFLGWATDEDLLPVTQIWSDARGTFSLLSSPLPLLHLISPSWYSSFSYLNNNAIRRWRMLVSRTGVYIWILLHEQI